MLRVLPLAPVVVVGLLSGRPPTPLAVHALPASGSGSVRLANSLGGGAVLSAQNMQPGRPVTGTVEIANSGDSDATLRLAQSAPHDSPGVGGENLSRVLELRVVDQTAHQVVYAGPLSAFSSADGAPLAAGTAHEFLFVVQMDDVSSVDSYQGAATTVDYSWTGASSGADSDSGSSGSSGGSGAGAGSGGGPPPTPGDVRPPVLRLTGKASQRARAVSLTATCDEPCRVTAGAAVKGAGRGVKRPKAIVKALAGGKRATVKLVFDKRSLKKIKRGTATVTVVATDAAGNRTKATKRIKLKR